MSSSYVAIQPPAAVYREEQYFGWWVYALLVLMAGVGAATLARGGHVAAAPAAAGWTGDVPLVLAVGLVVPSVLVVGVLRMTTEVAPTSCAVWFGIVPTICHNIPISLIDRVEVVTYRPLRDCGGWGIRRGPEGERVFNARGDRGVRLWMTDGTRILIGSQSPEDLAIALERAIRPEG